MARSPSGKLPASEIPTALQYAAHVPDVMLTMARIQGRVLDAMLQQNIQMLDFLKGRFENDRKLAEALAAAEGAEAALAIWGDFWRQAVEDYATEPQRLSRVAASAADEAIRLARQEAAAVMNSTKATAV